jgi:metal-dependent hydrolase (beta-lactamase superfamily II)
MKELNSVRVTTLVENDVWKTGLTFSWGISLYVETYKGEERHTVLMDTSGSFATLSNNASKLEELQ